MRSGISPALPNCPVHNLSLIHIACANTMPLSTAMEFLIELRTGQLQRIVPSFPFLSLIHIWTVHIFRIHQFDMSLQAFFIADIPGMNDKSRLFIPGIVTHIIHPVRCV